MNKNRLIRAFTLVELLVVISIIALLLSILMPSLSKARKQGQAVVCLSNLRQWGLAFALYGNANNDLMPEFTVAREADKSWMTTLSAYGADVVKFRFCPSATKVADLDWNGQAGTIYDKPGDTFRAWYVNAKLVSWLPDEDYGVGSYGNNDWCHSNNAYDQIFGGNFSYAKLATPGAYLIPLFFDCRWSGIVPRDTTLAPRQKDVPGLPFYSLKNWHWVNGSVMRRHKKGVNMVFLDMSAKNVAAEELWDFKWHRNWNYRGPKANLSWLD